MYFKVTGAVYISFYHLPNSSLCIHYGTCFTLQIPGLGLGKMSLCQSHLSLPFFTPHLNLSPGCQGVNKGQCKYCAELQLIFTEIFEISRGGAEQGNKPGGLATLTAIFHFDDVCEKIYSLLWNLKEYFALK